MGIKNATYFFKDANNFHNSITGYIDDEDWLTYSIWFEDDLQSIKEIVFYGFSNNGGFCIENSPVNGAYLPVNITRNDSVVGGYIEGNFSGVVSLVGSGGPTGTAYGCTETLRPIIGSFRLKIQNN